MIDYLLSPLRDKLQKIAWIGNTVGVVSPFERKLENGDTQRIPLTCDICLDSCCNEPYKIFTPDNTDTSLIFFQADDPINYTHDRDVMTLNTKVNMVLWVNLAAFGQSDYCAAKSQFALNLLKQLPYKYKSDNQIVQYSAIDISHNFNPFDVYDFDNLPLIIYPYAAITISVDVNATIGLLCIDDIIIKASIDCM